LRSLRTDAFSPRAQNASVSHTISHIPQPMQRVGSMWIET